MGFFDQPYYAVTKTHMCRIGMWPEQSKHVRIIRLSTVYASVMSMILPRITRLNDFWSDTDALVQDMPLLVVGLGSCAILLHFIQNFEKIKLPFDNMERHWEMLKNTPAVVVLGKHTERGQRFAAINSNLLYILTVFYWFLILSPIILDVIHPLNDTRSKMYLVYTEYGVDRDKYYFFVYAHEFIVYLVTIATVIAIGVMYCTWTVHACALFEVVGFAELIESTCRGPGLTTLLIISIAIVFTAVQALKYLKQRSVLLQSAAFTLYGGSLLYVISLPGQELINRSEQIRTMAYDLEWPDMLVEAQKLLIPIIVRSSKPCRITAGKVYVVSMESFGSTIRTVFSYFTIFAQMI